MWCGRENSSAVHGGNRCESTGVCRRGFVSRILTHSLAHTRVAAVSRLRKKNTERKKRSFKTRTEKNRKRNRGVALSNSNRCALQRADLSLRASGQHWRSPTLQAAVASLASPPKHPAADAHFQAACTTTRIPPKWLNSMHLAVPGACGEPTNVPIHSREMHQTHGCSHNM